MGNELKHTHYSPYGPPRSVPGTLLDCADSSRSPNHRIEDSELWADYLYSPRLGPVSDTGLLPEMERELITAYTERKREDLQYRIADVVADLEHTYRVRITCRTSNPHGPDWHTEEWGLHPDGQWRSTYNPHPGYEHWPAWCPNCGY